MRIARLPLLLLPVLAIAIAVFLTLLATALLEQVHLRGAYQVWQENETFAAACVALLAAMFAARPVYLQVQAQSVQAALDLLHRTEAETEAVIGARKILFEVRRGAIALAGEINAFGDKADESSDRLKKALADFMAIGPRELRALAERPTINSTDQMKIATLSCVLAIAQQMTNDMLIEHDGRIAHHMVAGAGISIEQARRPVQSILGNCGGLRRAGGIHARAGASLARACECVVSGRALCAPTPD